MNQLTFLCRICKMQNHMSIIHIRKSIKNQFYTILECPHCKVLNVKFVPKEEGEILRRET